MNDSKKRSDLFAQLADLADRLQSNPTYMAWVLHAYGRKEGLSSDRMISRLGTSADMLTRLALCKRPEADSPLFAEQVRQIAEYTAIDASLLANVIRQVDALVVLAKMPVVPDTLAGRTSKPPVTSGVLTAARDRVGTDLEEPTAPNEGEAKEDEQ